MQHSNEGGGVNQEQIKLYQEARYETIEISAIDPVFSGFWVKLLRPPFMLRMEYVRLWGPQSVVDDSGDVDMEALAKRVNDKIAGSVVDWNLVDMDGKPLPVPTKNDLTPLDSLPGIVVEFIFGKLTESMADWGQKLGEAVSGGSES